MILTINVRVFLQHIVGLYIKQQKNYWNIEVNPNVEAVSEICVQGSIIKQECYE